MAWRSFFGRFNFELDLLDIIIVQSVWCRRIAKCSPWFGVGEKLAVMIRSAWRSYDYTMHYLHFLADVLITQSIARRWSANRLCVALRNSHAMTIQTAVRAMQARKRLKRLRAAITIQTTWHGFICYSNFMFVISDVILMHSVARRWLQQKEYPRLLHEHKRKAATVAQISLRRYMHSTDYLITISDIVPTQSVVQSWIKRKEYPKLLSERKTGTATKILSRWRGCSQTAMDYVMVFEKDAATLQSHSRRLVRFS
jgi:hypothetical protein